MSKGNGTSVVIGSLRLDGALVKEIDRIAKEQGRSRTSQIRQLLKDAVETETVSGIPQKPGGVSDYDKPAPAATEDPDDWSTPEPEHIKDTAAPRTNRCPHGNDLKFCMQCKITAKKYGGKG